MTDDELPAAEARKMQDFVEIVEDMTMDPDTRGLTMAGVGPDLGAVAQSFTDEDYETRVTLCAMVLKEQVSAIDADATDFIKDVVSEFNDRRVSHEYENK
jgi:hypothetical protein